MPPSNNSNNNSSNTNNNNNSKKKTYRSHHSDYRPFLDYIEHHAGIDDTTVQRARSKFGTTSSTNSPDTDTDTTRTKTTTPNTAMSSSSSSYSVATSFGSQRTKAATRAERDDARHADLHANVKHKDLEDSDKIFLLKREIDTLRGTIRGQQQQGGNSVFHTTNNHGPWLLSALLVVLVAGVSARVLSRRLRRFRAADALLSEAVPSSGAGVELREHGGRWAPMGGSYEAPPGNGSSSGAASLSFV